MKGKIIENSSSEALIILEDCTLCLLPLNKTSSFKKCGDSINVYSTNYSSSSKQRLTDFYL
ncbi:Uncharacterised protein [Clostridium putrefaciens]|uniref:Uncharacterized protein n=1 Tax=Clostridium putrefaciens TaxID=99675 RepID=A0A381JAW5_9CLOT|nr:hypothetical protein [Clostridium putrefaciens]SUY48351.1 Uncharacterised protein [Clostridium putrefaciens]